MCPATRANAARVTVSALPGYRERERERELNQHGTSAWSEGGYGRGLCRLNGELVYVCESEQEGEREKEKVAIVSGGFALWERSQSNYRQQCKPGFFS